MDTKYWGPSGWRLLHLIAENQTVTASHNKKFWSIIPYILPCKFCRASLSTYYEQHPIPSNPKEMGPWLYKIHNCVNAKLREQGQTIIDPPYSIVKKHYRDLLASPCTETSFPGWEFLFCIADNYPGSAPSKPMPDTPEGAERASIGIRNKYNLLTDAERIDAIGTFWSLLPTVLPYTEWRTVWSMHCTAKKEACITDFAGRAAAKRRIWKIKCAMDDALEKHGTDTYYGICREVAAKRSGCSTARRARTCRARPKKQ
jgi:hypothetical protein